MNGLMAVSVLGLLSPLCQGWVRSAGSQGVEVFQELISRNEVVAYISKMMETSASSSSFSHHLPPSSTSSRIGAIDANSDSTTYTTTTTSYSIPISLGKIPPTAKRSLWDELFSNNSLSSSSSSPNGGGGYGSHNHCTLIYSCSASVTARRNGLHESCSLDAIQKRTNIRSILYTYGGGCNYDPNSSSATGSLTSIDKVTLGLSDVLQTTKLVAFISVENVSFDDVFERGLIRSIGIGFLTDFKGVDLTPLVGNVTKLRKQYGDHGLEKFLTLVRWDCS